MVKSNTDVATGTWSLVSSVNNLDVTVGLLALKNEGEIDLFANARSGSVIAQTRWW